MKVLYKQLYPFLLSISKLNFLLQPGSYIPFTLSHQNPILVHILQKYSYTLRIAFSG